MIFSRYPRAGRVKKRLVPALGRAAATRLYRQMVEQTCRTASRLRDADVQVWIADAAAPDYADRISAKYGCTCHTQTGRDLGERMYRAFQANQSAYAFQLLIGCDCPQLDCTILQEAVAALRNGADAVLGPAADGGYYLIALKQAHPEIFQGVEWGSDSVARATRERLNSHGLVWDELAVLNDIDRPEDLALPLPDAIS